MVTASAADETGRQMGEAQTPSRPDAAAALRRRMMTLTGAAPLPRRVLPQHRAAYLLARMAERVPHLLEEAGVDPASLPDMPADPGPGEVPPYFRTIELPATVKVHSSREKTVVQLGDRYVVKAQFGERNGLHGDERRPWEFGQESLLQQLLGERLEGRVPRVSHIDEGLQFFVMECAPGMPLHKSDFSEMRAHGSEERVAGRKRLAADLTRFFNDARDAVSTAEADALNLGPDALQRPAPGFSAQTGHEDLAELPEDVTRAVNNPGLARNADGPPDAGGVLEGEIVPRLAALARPQWCHEDLAERNIMVDPKTGHLTAVIDVEASSFRPGLDMERSSRFGDAYGTFAELDADGTWHVALRRFGGEDPQGAKRPAARELVDYARKISRARRGPENSGTPDPDVLSATLDTTRGWWLAHRGGEGAKADPAARAEPGPGDPRRLDPAAAPDSAPDAAPPAGPGPRDGADIPRLQQPARPAGPPRPQSEV